jgi:hypothetical protein
MTKWRMFDKCKRCGLYPKITYEHLCAGCREDLRNG